MHNAIYTRATGRTRRRLGAVIAGGLAITLVFASAALADKVIATNGNDAFAAATGPSLVFALGGNDLFAGDPNTGSGNDILLGGPGTDGFAGRAGDDILIDDDANNGDGLAGDFANGTGTGNDFIAAANGVFETINCGGGTDFVAADDADDVNANCENVYRTNTPNVSLTLPAPFNTLFPGPFNLIFGTNNSEGLRGTSGSDIIFAKGGNDGITSGDGSDIVFGGSGSDGINAGAGSDIVIDDDASADSINSGAGNDLVLVLNGNLGGRDVVNCDAGTDRVHFDTTPTASIADVVNNCEDKNPSYPPTL